MSLTKEQKEVITTLREAYVLAGSKRGPVCTNLDCAMLATKRVFWPVTPTEDEPLYCDDCALWAKQILETLGVKYREEPLSKHTDEAFANTHTGGRSR